MSVSACASEAFVVSVDPVATGPETGSTAGAGVGGAVAAACAAACAAANAAAFSASATASAAAFAAAAAAFSASAIASAAISASRFAVNLVAIASALASRIDVSKSSPLSTEIMASSTKSIARFVSSRFERQRLIMNGWSPEFVDITNLSGSINCSNTSTAEIKNGIKNNVLIMNIEIKDAPETTHQTPLKSSSQSNL